MEHIVFKFKRLLFWLPLLGFVVSGIIILPLLFAAYILIKPWSLWTYRKISSFFGLLMYWQPTYLTLWWSGTNIEIFMNPKDLHNFMGKEHSILLPNHRYETELFTIMTILNYFGCAGNLRGVSKKSLQYLPVTGWLWKLLEYIFLERNFEKDKQIIARDVKSLMKHSDPVTVIFFVEGTRFTEQKHKSSMTIAEDKELPKLKHHLLPRTRGFTTCIDTLKNGNNFGLPVAVYDALFVMKTANQKNRSCSILDQLQGNGQSVKLFLRRFPVQNIPENEIECANWLNKVYQEKDELMANCLQTGKFVVKRDDNMVIRLGLQDFESITVPKPLHVFLFIGAWNIICLLTVLLKIVHVLQSKDSFQLIAFVAIMAVLYGILRILTSSTQVKTGSSYGKISKNEHREGKVLNRT